MKNGLKIIHAPAIVETIMQSLKENGQITIRGLGTFYELESGKKKNTLPTSNEIKNKRRIKFKASPSLKKRLNSLTK